MHRGESEGRVLSIIQEGRISKACAGDRLPLILEGGEDALAFIKLENLLLVLVEAERRAGSYVEVLWLYTFNKPRQHMHASVWDPTYWLHS